MHLEWFDSGSVFFSPSVAAVRQELNGAQPIISKKGSVEERNGNITGRCNMHVTSAGETASLKSLPVLPAPWKEGITQENVFLYRNKEATEW